jgi:hypothetical protein
MGVYESCTSCKGRGYFDCNTCHCQNCKSIGKIKCSNCQSGKVTCSNCREGRLPCIYCNATGEITRKGWIFTHHDVCSECKGAKRILCQTCKGYGSLACSLCDGKGGLICSSCQGKGRLTKCSHCGGTQKLPCKDCDQKGKVEGQWIKAIRELPVERLRFEHEKRQSEIGRLQIQASRLENEFEQIQRDWEQALKDLQNRYGTVAGINMFDASGFQSASSRTMDDMSKANRRIYDLQDEMNAIEQILDYKWK